MTDANIIVERTDVADVTALAERVGADLAALLPRAEAATALPDGTRALGAWERLLAKGAEKRLDWKASADREEGRAGVSQMRHETFGRLYGDPKEHAAVKREHRWMKRVHEALDQIPDFEALRARTHGDELWSEMAVKAMYEAAMKALPDATEREKRAAEARARVEGLAGMASLGIPCTGDDLGEALAELEALDEEETAEEDNAALRAALRKAIGEVTQDIDATADALAMFQGAGGKGAGAQEKDMRDPAKRAALAKRLKGSRDLKAIMAEAGRLRRIIAAKRAMRASHAPEELCDIELGGDIERLLPAELSRMAHPLLKLDTYRRIMERSALQSRLRGREKQGRGPIVVCVDESGSMNGARNTWAKGLALALMDLAGADGRGFALVAFDASVQSVYVRKAKEPHDPAKLIDVVATFSGGGTAFEPPLKKARQLIEREGLEKADIMFVTDGEAYIGDTFADEFTAWREANGVSVYGFPIGTEVSTLKRFCTTIVKLSEAGQDDGGVTDAVASI